jgi:hypothetical protein
MATDISGRVLCKNSLLDQMLAQSPHRRQVRRNGYRGQPLGCREMVFVSLNVLTPNVEAALRVNPAAEFIQAPPICAACLAIDECAEEANDRLPDGIGR